MKPRKPLLDPDHPMFAKPWVRWLVTLAPLVWAGFEFWTGNPFWGMLFGAAGLYAGWTLIYNR